MHSDPVISAEIVPVSGNKQAAARALQRRGFRVLRLDDTISVDAPRSLWTSTFGVAFQPEKRTLLREVSDSTTIYLKAKEGTVLISPELQNVVEEVIFVEPPELY